VSSSIRRSRRQGRDHFLFHRRATLGIASYSLPPTVARKWGLYISSSRGKTSINIEEPPLFLEPGVFLVRPDGTLYYGAVQTMPFARPLFSELLQAIDFAIAKDYPARGEYDGPV
jgi:hypothetical protein